MNSNVAGSGNTAVGSQSLVSNQGGIGNTAVGGVALHLNNGGLNTAVGYNALGANTSGQMNIALGVDAGRLLTTGSYNIDIGDPGVAGESHTIRIGRTDIPLRTFLGGVRNVTPGQPDGLAVIIDSTGQLGTSTTVGAVTSVFGRTGAVTAQAGDYSASQVTNEPTGNLAATDVQAAVNELDAEKAPASHTHAGSDITSAVANATNAVNADTVDGLHASAFVQGETVPVIRTDFDVDIDTWAGVWNYATTGLATASINMGVANLSTPGTPAGSATLWGVKQLALASGALILGFTSKADGQGLLLGDMAPRGLVNGTDRANAIEVLSETSTSVRFRTVSGGTATETVVPLGHTLQVPTMHQIVATATSVKLYIDGELVATHTTSIPTVPLNPYFDVQYDGTGVLQLNIFDVTFERRF